MSFYFVGPSSAALSQHTDTPDITSSTVVLTTDDGAVTTDITTLTFVPHDYSEKATLHRIQLLKVHGKYIYYKLKKGCLMNNLIR